MHPLHELTEADLRRRTSMKWRTYPDDVLPMFVAEMDVVTPEPVARAVRDAVERGDTGYPAEEPVYARAWADFSADRWGFAPDVGRSVPVADVMAGVVTAIRTVSKPGDPVVINPPVYPPFFEAVRSSGRSLVEVPLGGDGRLDLDELGAAFERTAFGGRTVTYLLCSPHNPTGAVHTREELTAVARLAAEHGVRVVVDEIHSPLAGPRAAGGEPGGGAGPRAADEEEAEAFVPYLDVSGSENAYSVVSASKAWNLAGFKAGLLLGGPDTAQELEDVSYLVSHGPGHLGTIAHVAALREARDWLAALHADLAVNRESIARFLAERLPEVRSFLGPGTYLGWLDLRALDLGDDPAEVLLERARVALLPGGPFGCGAGHARLNYGTTPQILAEALERIAVAVGR